MHAIVASMLHRPIYAARRALPKRGGLLYAPASDGAALARLRKAAASPRPSSLRVASAPSLFKDGMACILCPAERMTFAGTR